VTRGRLSLLGLYPLASKQNVKDSLIVSLRS